MSFSAFPVFPHIPYHNRLSEPVVTVYLKTDLITVGGGGQSVDFLLDTGATYSVLTEAPGLLSSRSASVMGLSRKAKGIISVILYVVPGILCYFHTSF